MLWSSKVTVSSSRARLRTFLRSGGERSVMCVIPSASGMIIKFCKWRETRSTPDWDSTRAVQEVERATTQIGYERNREAGLQERERVTREI